MFAVGNPPGLYRAARDSLEELLCNLFSAKRYSESPGQISKEAVLNSDSNSYLSPFDFVCFLGERLRDKNYEGDTSTVWSCRYCKLC